LKLPEARRPNEVGCTNLNYCLFHRMIHYLTNKCFALKDKIQALVDAGVLTLKSEQKKVTANMVTLEFSKTPKVTVPDGSFPIPEAQLEINDHSTKYQEIKGLVPLTLKTGEIMWIPRPRPRRTDSKKSKLKGKSCNVISVLSDDGNVTTASLSDSESERHACTAQADVPQPTGTRSGKSYLKQYEKITDETTANDVSTSTHSSSSSDLGKREAERSLV